MAKLDDQTTTQDVRHDYEYLAGLANLRYVSDNEPGFTRRRWGRGFTYKDASPTPACKPRLIITDIA